MSFAINETPGAPIKSRLPEIIGLGVGLAAGITGASFEAFSLVNRSERTSADWIMMTSWITVIASSVFGLFRIQQSPRSDYALLEEGRIQPNYDQEGVSQEIDTLYKSIISHQSDEIPNNISDLEKLKLIETHYRSLVQQQLNGTAEPQNSAPISMNGEGTPLLLQQTRDDLARLTAELAAAQTQKAQLEKRLETSMKLSQGYLEKQSPLEQENKKLKREIAEKAEEISSLEADVEDLERRNINLTSELAVLQEEIEKIELNFQGALSFNGTITAETVKNLGARLTQLKEKSRSASQSSSSPASMPNSPSRPKSSPRFPETKVKFDVPSDKVKPE